jgi:hypothetical protein
VSATAAKTPLSLTRIVSLLAPPLLVMAAIFLMSAQTSSGDHTLFDH